MNNDLAEQLLAKVMDWSPEDIARERPIIQALSSYKFDEYQQFSPGMRFVESLALWLNQFDLEERKIAYNFIKSQLIFISDAEMAHLVSIMYNDNIRPILMKQVAKELDISELCPIEIEKTKEFKILLRQSLFLGLSDGAHIDVFRRSNPRISNEQVWQTYEISNDKAKNMLSELKEDLDKLLGRPANENELKFRMIFLLDDFSGSGISYFRKDVSENVYKGKIKKIMERFTSINGDKHNDLRSLINLDDLQIWVVLAVATEQASKKLKDVVAEWLESEGLSIQGSIIVIQTIPEAVKIDPKINPEIKEGVVNLLSKYFDDRIIDEHYIKGKHDKPHLGFDECALPLILSHNTPNNSLPILWFEPTQWKYRGLFPRISRHKEE